MKKEDLKVYKVVFYAVAALLLFMAGAFSSYIFLKSYMPLRASEEVVTVTSEGSDGFQWGKYAIASKAEDIVRASLEPYNAKLIQFYMDRHGTVYIDVSGELEKNFQGSLMDEYLVVSGLLKSLNTHIPSIKTMKVLIEGRETDTLGGHISLMVPVESKMISENIVLH
jgi:hypothetical protein